MQPIWNTEPSTTRAILSTLTRVFIRTLIEGTWHSVKVGIPEKVRYLGKVENHISEFIWRRQSESDIWSAFLNCLAQSAVVQPPCYAWLLVCCFNKAQSILQVRRWISRQKRKTRSNECQFARTGQLALSCDRVSRRSVVGPILKINRHLSCCIKL